LSKARDLLDRLSEIRAREAEVSEEDIEKGQREREWFASNKQAFYGEILDLLKTYNQSNSEARNARVWLSTTVFWLVTGWLAAVILLVTASGIFPAFDVDDRVLIALITGASVSVVGLLAAIVAYYFNQAGHTTAIYRQIIDRVMEK
jgi:hypothetical protein